MKDRELEIPSKAPFTNCKLNRAVYANVLTSIIEAYNDGFVLAVDGKWGSGKTTFMKMWRQSLSIQKYKTIYFNAWENDFTSEPMVAIMGEIRSVISEEDHSTLDNILVKGQKFCNAIIPALAKVATSLSGMGSIADAVEKAADAMLQTIDTEIKEYENKKNGLAEFREELSEFITEKNGGKPIVFIVDELDRCRPDYAVEVLEKIKHLFAVDGIVFVLSIDKEQLGNAIRGYYGSDRIEADEYLRRFIDLEYALPMPNYYNFCRFICSKNNLYKYLSSHFDSIQMGLDEQEEDLKNQKAIEKPKGFKMYEYIYFTFTAACSKKHNLSLRQINKIFSRLKVVIREYKDPNYLHLHIIFFLLIIKDHAPSIYKDLESLEKDEHTIGDELTKLYKDCIVKDSHDVLSLAFTVTTVLILKFYSNSLRKTKNRHISTFYKIIENSEPIRYELVNKFDYPNKRHIMLLMNQTDSQYNQNLTSLLNKIDLLSPLVS